MPKRKREERYPREITYGGIVYVIKNKKGRPKKGQRATPSHYVSVDGSTRLELDFVEQYISTLEAGAGSSTYPTYPTPPPPQIATVQFVAQIAASSQPASSSSSPDSNANLRNQVEQYCPDDAVLYREGEKILCRLSAGRNVVVVMKDLGPKISEAKQGCLFAYDKHLQVPRETRYKRIFNPGDNFENIPHRCILPVGFQRGIKQWPRSKEHLRVSYFSDRWYPSPAVNVSEVRQCLNKYFTTPYPSYMLDFSPYTCYCKSNYDDPALYFYQPGEALPTKPESVKF